MLGSGSARMGQAASELAPTCERRKAHTQRAGIPTPGLVEAVRALTTQGHRLVRLAAVDAVPFHFHLLLDDALATVAGCTGVDQRLGYRLRPGDQVSWTSEVVARVSEGSPGWVCVCG